ncbi:hypothetical protein ATKI12_5811 [Kitasatospora sp. Ki12]
MRRLRLAGGARGDGYRDGEQDGERDGYPGVGVGRLGRYVRTRRAGRTGSPAGRPAG